MTSKIAPTAKKALNIFLETKCFSCRKEIARNNPDAYDLKITDGWLVVCSLQCFNELNEFLEKKGGLIIGPQLRRGEIISTASQLLRTGMPLEEIASTIPTSVEYLELFIVQ